MNKPFLFCKSLLTNQKQQMKPLLIYCLVVPFKYRAFMFHLLIIPGETMIPDDFQFTRSKVKVTRNTIVITYIKQFPTYFLNIICYKVRFNSQDKWFRWFNWDMTGVFWV